MSKAASDHPYATQLAMRERLEKAVQAGPIAFVDLGSHKFAALIAEAKREGEELSFRVLGAAIQPAVGMAKGAPSDQQSAAARLAQVVDEAARAARRRPVAAVATLSGMAPRSAPVSAEIDLTDGAVKREDVAKVVAAAKPSDEGEARFLLHGVPLRWRIDGVVTLGDPTGRYGRRLAVMMLAVGVDRPALHGLARVVRGAGLDMIASAAAPYASALAATTREERALGATCIEFGAATTSVALFDQGRLAAVKSMPQGGALMTEKIARSLDIKIAEAEWLKQSYGSATATIAGEPVELARPGARPVRVQRGALVAAIRPRVFDLLTSARDLASEVASYGGSARPIILTGGATELDGFAAAAQEVLGPNARIAGPMGPPALGQLASPGAWAASVGLVSYVAGAPEQAFDGIDQGTPKAGSLWRWLRDSW